MNFKTTVILIVLLAVAGAVLFFTRDRGSATSEQSTSESNTQKLLSIDAADVTKLSLAPADGKKMVLDKSGGTWEMTEPVKSQVDTFAVDSLVRAITDAQSRGTIDVTSDNAASTGVREPSYVVEIATKDGKTTTLNVGRRSTVGDNLYVSLDGNKDQARLISGDLWDQLEKPANSYRRQQLIDVPSTAVNHVRVDRPGGRLVLNRVNDQWNVVEPVKMPAEKSEVDDLIFAVTGLRAGEFISENPADAPKYQLDQPSIRVTLDTGLAATQPATNPAASKPGGTEKTINFGAYTDVLKKNVYAMVAGGSTIVSVPASALEKLTVKPLDLRDRKVLDIDPQQVSRIEIKTDLAATTQPTTRPASQKDVVIVRRKETAKPAPSSAPAPTTSPATTQAGTQPASAPASQPAASTWQLAGSTTQPATQPTDAGDSTVDSLLSSLHPLRATRYLEKAPTTQPSATYTLTVTTQAAGGAPEVRHVVTFTDRGTSEPLIGASQDLVFEADRSLISKLEADFSKSAEPSEPSSPETGGPGIPHLPGVE